MSISTDEIITFDSFDRITPFYDRMAFFERQGVLLTFDQLASEAKGHYILQAVQQAYVFVLGLDVLGNPYGLVKDFTKGLGDFFYEPMVVGFQLLYQYKIFNPLATVLKLGLFRSLHVA